MEESEELKKMRIEADIKSTELYLKQTELENSYFEAERLSKLITEIVTKIGAVLISMYLISILLSLTSTMHPN